MMPACNGLNTALALRQHESARVAATAQPAPYLLVALCGLPGSGKSTLCARLTACAQAEGVACHTVSFDAFEPKGEAFDPTAWKVCDTRLYMCSVKSCEAERLQLRRGAWRR